MAITAVHAQLVDMEGMIELDRLGGLIAHPGIFGSKVVGHSGDDAGGDHGDTDQNFDGKPVGPAWEDVGHGEVMLLTGYEERLAPWRNLKTEGWG